MAKSGVLVSQFSTERGFGSAAIRYLSESDVSHVDLVVPRTIALKRLNAFKMPPPMQYGLLGARMNGGVQLRSFNYADFTRTVTVGCKVPDIDAAYEFAFEQLGKPYNKAAIADFFLHKLHKTRKFRPNQESWDCDALNYQIYAEGGVQLLDTDCPLDLTPQMELLSPYWTTQQAV